MPKTMRDAVKGTKNKPKLTPEQRSDVAKARWAKIRAEKGMEEVVVTINTMLEQDAKDTPNPQPPEQLPVTPESISTEHYISGNATVTTEGPPVAGAKMKIADDVGVTTVYISPTPPAPQLTPVAPKKAKRIPVPKEFLTALKTADSLLAKAIEEYEDCQRRITYLSGSIPRLQRTVLALRNESNPDAPIPLPNAFNYNAPTAFQLPPAPQFQPYVDPLAAIAGAAAAPPVSKASGRAMQFSPDMVGTLEGPEDEDDPDCFISGPNAGGGWIGG